MTIKHFYIFRHGETELNVAGRFQGQSCNESLNEKGIQQAEQLGNCLQAYEIDYLVSSPLKRALETANIIGKKLHLQTHIDINFIEGNFGVIEGKTKAELTEREKALFSQWVLLHEDYLDICFDKGESKRAIINRAMKGLRKLAKLPYTKFAISTHSAVIRMILQNLGVKQQNIPNGKPFHIIYKNGKFKFQIEDRFLLLSCCAPCSCAVIQKLAEENLNFTVVFYNPNIYPFEEYVKRRDENKRVCEIYHIPFTELEYNHQQWCDLTSGMENEPEKGKRCSLCFHMRLKRAMEYALENGYVGVASVLGVSRFKNLNQVNLMASYASFETNCPYFEIEGRKDGMQELRTKLVADLKLYNQTYCGCKPSSFLKK